ncbi:MAG: SCO family protein, partial [Pseudomonadota bacterium]
MVLIRAALLALLAWPAHADEGAQATIAAPFPANFGGAYVLTDHHGTTRTQVDPAGHLQLIFFGYASCEAICTVALPIMSDVATALAQDG